MSIFKESFKQGVKDQITARQNAISSIPRSADSIQYFNSRNAWIKMSSAVNVAGDNGDLARKNTLLGGVLSWNGSSYGQRAGVGSSNEAYSTNTSGGTPHRLGIRPMPGITSIQVRSRSAYGSLREVTVNFQCWDIRQLEELELLYMRPGYSVLVEWGWFPYLNNKGNLQTAINKSDYLFLGKTKEEIWSELFERSSQDGNFDSAYGLIKNYSWSARDDGGYDCNTTIITMGEVLESLKVNYGAFEASDLQTKGLFPVPNKPQFQTNQSLISRFLSFIGGNSTANTTSLKDDVANAYSQNIIAGICAELYNITIANSVVASKSVSDYNLVDSNNNNYSYNFLKYEVQINNLTGPTIIDGKQQVYIRLADFIEILNKYVILSDKKNKTPISKLSVYDAGNYKLNQTGSLLQCLGDIHQISTNPSVCLIKNIAYDDPAATLYVTGLDVTGVKSYLNEMTYNYLDTNTEFGTIGNIYVNLDYLYGLSVNNTLAAQDKKEKNNLILFDYIKSVMSGINTAIGNVANFDIFIDPIDSVARIIDVNYVDSTSRDQAYKDAFEIQIQNLKSVVRSYKFESQIFPEMSSVIAIGAQAQGGALAEDTNTLVDFNKNLVDRVIPKKDAPTSPEDSIDPIAELKTKLDNLQQNWANIAEYFIELNPDWWGSDYDVEESSKYANSLKDIIGFFKSIINKNTKNRAIIPTKLSLEMDGIGGMIIGNMFKIPKDIVPKGYGGDLNYNAANSTGPEKLAYVVTGLNHSLQNNDWTTTIDAQFIILDEPRGLDKTDIKTIQAINRIVTTSAPGGVSCGDVTNRSGKWKNLTYESYAKTTVSDTDVVNYLKNVTDKSVRRAAYAIFANESGRGNKGVNNNYIGLQTDGGGFIATDANYVKGTTSVVDSGGNCRAFATYATWQKCIDHLVAVMASRKQGGGSSRIMVPTNPADANFFGNGYARNWVANLDPTKLAQNTSAGKALWNEAISKGL